MGAARPIGQASSSIRFRCRKGLGDGANAQCKFTVLLDKRFQCSAGLFRITRQQGINGEHQRLSVESHGPGTQYAATSEGVPTDDHRTQAVQNGFLI